MSEPVPPAPSMPEPPPVVARLDPPTDVQEAVAAALRACHAWQPVAAPRPVPAQGPMPLPFTPQTAEAGVCDLIDNWPHGAGQAAHAALGAGVALGLAGVAVLLAVRGMVRWLGRTQPGWWLRDRLRGPWRDAQAASLGGVLGFVAGALLHALLRKLGADAPAVAHACWLGGALVGACGLVLARRRGVLQLDGWARP